ncbi:MAG: AmpG family muropeptide MFS transporter [Succinivibrionaceae bacterium]
MQNSESNQIETVSIWNRIFSKRMFLCLVFGFSSGLPLYLLVNLISAWLKDNEVDLSTISVCTSIALFPYTWKFLWAPLVDRYNILKIGRRKSWTLLTQILLIFLISFLGFITPSSSTVLFSTPWFAVNNMFVVTSICLLISISSATQDIALDAFRREILADIELGLGNSIFVNSYRIAGMVPGGLSLILSEYLPWSIVFLLTSLFFIPCALVVFFIKEPLSCKVPLTIAESVIYPFIEFVKRKGWGALIFILFIFLYKFGDNLATALSTPFYMEMGYSKIQIGIVNKTIGLWTMIIGGMIGGILMLKIGINKALWIFGVGQIITILGFVLIAHVWKNPMFVPNMSEYIDSCLGIRVLDNFSFPNFSLLSFVVGAEYLGVGLGTSCFVAYMCRETNPAYVATQLALFTALAAVPRTVGNAITGKIVELLGWENFFVVCYACAIPGMLLLLYVAPFNSKK